MYLTEGKGNATHLTIEPAKTLTNHKIIIDITENLFSSEINLTLFL